MAITNHEKTRQEIPRTVDGRITAVRRARAEKQLSGRVVRGDAKNFERHAG